MDTASLQFILFGLLVAIVSNLSRARAWRSAVLLVSSCVFLGLVAPHFALLLPLFGFLALGYAGVTLLRRGWVRSPARIIGIIVLAFIWLKQYTFLPGAIFVRSPYLTLGLSYILFRVLHLVIESGEGGDKTPVAPIPYLIYTLNFTTFVFGPIQRYPEFARDQFAAEPIPLPPSVIGLQLERIARGFFKVNVLALLFDIVRTDDFARLSQPLPGPAKFAAALRLTIAYPLFLYLNLSGYMDIVVALARLMRIRLPENFDRPFSATSFVEFWKRWHITLSRWLNDYVYTPLSMALIRPVRDRNRASYLGILSYFVTFFLIGIWHGRTSEFAVFGLLQGLGVAVNKLWELKLSKRLGRRRYKALNVNPVYETLSRGLTFTWFAFTMYWFWAGWRQIHTAFTSLGAAGWVAVLLAVWVSATVGLAGWEWLRARLLSLGTEDHPLLTSRYARVVYASAFALATFAVIVLLDQPAPEIVYKAF